MDDTAVKRLALIFALRAEIEGMKIANYQRKIRNESPMYGERNLFEKAEELQEMARVSSGYIEKLSY